MVVFDDLLSVISFNVVSRVRPRKVLGVTDKAVRLIYSQLSAAKDRSLPL